MEMGSLADAAFGGAPQRWPLPAADTRRDRWLRAVAAAGGGHYALAQAELEMLLGDPGALGSLARSTRASLLRQLGWHALARGWDGRALLAAVDTESRADALTGLAADALGLGRFAASARLLEHAAQNLAGAQASRLTVRLGWVRAELAMATGDGPAAVRHARAAVAAADGLPSTRHRVKSRVVLAAALCCAGEIAAARAHAEHALDQTGRYGLIPLRWAVSSLLIGIGADAHTPAELIALRDDAADLVGHRGGVWRG